MSSTCSVSVDNPKSKNALKIVLIKDQNKDSLNPDSATNVFKERQFKA